MKAPSASVPAAMHSVYVMVYRLGILACSARIPMPLGSPAKTDEPLPSDPARQLLCRHLCSFKVATYIMRGDHPQ